jgi:multisubunit Na+/H+ antiporter MnhC subunit
VRGDVRSEARRIYSEDDVEPLSGNWPTPMVVALCFVLAITAIVIALGVVFPEFLLHLINDAKLASN